MPIIPESRVLKAATETLLNTIRDGASAEYRARVPVATRTNITTTVGPRILSMVATQNEFLTSLVNRIALVLITSRSYSNPLKPFKKGMLEYGETVEEIFVNIATAQEYDPAKSETELFKREIPDIAAAFHPQNYRNKFKATVQQKDLNRAFLTSSGVLDLVAKIVDSLYSGSEYDEFLNMKNLIYTYGGLSQFYPVQVPSMTTPTAADLNTLVASIKEYSNKLAFMSPLYNPMGVKTHTEKSRQVLFIDARLDALIDVNVLASAFNMDKAEFMGRRVLLDDFGGLTGIAAILADEDFFMVYDNLQQMGEIYNPDGLYWNYILHLWKIFSYSPFANCVAFVTGAPAVSAVATSPSTATVKKGATLQLYANVTAANYASKAVTWTITTAGATSKIDTKGLLTVDAAEAQATLTVVATSVYDGTKTGSATITVQA